MSRLRSERIIGQFLAGNPGAECTVATKMGRRVAQDPAFFTLDNFRAWTDRSRLLRPAVHPSAGGWRKSALPS